MTLLDCDKMSKPRDNHVPYVRLLDATVGRVGAYVSAAKWWQQALIWFWLGLGCFHSLYMYAPAVANNEADALSSNDGYSNACYSGVVYLLYEKGRQISLSPRIHFSGGMIACGADSIPGGVDIDEACIDGAMYLVINGFKRASLTPKFVESDGVIVPALCDRNI